MLEERKQKVPKTPKKHESYLFYPFIRPEEMLAQAGVGNVGATKSIHVKLYMSQGLNSLYWGWSSNL